MIKRLLLVLAIAGGVVMVPYLTGLCAVITLANFYPEMQLTVSHWDCWRLGLLCVGVLVFIGSSGYLAYKYIRYGSFLLLLFLGLGVKGQTLTGVRFNMGNTLDTTYMKGDTLTQVWDSTGRNCYQDLEKGTTNTMCTLTHWQITEVFYIHRRLELLSRKINLKPLYK